MKKILLVNHYWPPTGGPCTQRWLDFSSEFVNQGYEVGVVTPENAGFIFTDESLMDRVSPQIKVYKVPYGNVVSSARKNIGENILTKFIRGNFFLPDPRKSWNRNAIQFIGTIINDYDVLVTAGPPHSTHFIGQAFKGRIKWIADLHDYWTDAIYLKQFNQLFPAKMLDRHYEKTILNGADTVLVHCETAKRMYQERTSKPIHVITMGFHPAIFENIAVEVEKKSIYHIGSFFSSYTEGLTFISHLIKSGFTFYQVGHVDKGVEFPEGTVRIPYVTHPEAIKLMHKADYLLLINPYQHHLPGKIFEYLGAARPVLLVSPDHSEAENIIKHHQDKSRDEIHRDLARDEIAKEVLKIIEEL